MNATPEEIEHLVLMATHAPSVHNSQPWRFSTTRDGLTIHRDLSRKLGVIDPWGRELLMSCGAAIDHLVVAARALGLDATVNVEVEHDAVAHLRLARGATATETQIGRAVAIMRRHTDRGRYVGPALTASVLDELMGSVDAPSTFLRIVHPDELVEVEVLVSRAEQSLLVTPGYQAELARWVWHGEGDEGRTDGLPADAIGHGVGRAESLMGREFGGEPVPRPLDPPEVELFQTVVLLSTVHDGERDWVQAGRAMSALLLTATVAGLVAQPMGQVIDLPGPRSALAHLLGTVGYPQLLLRLGHGAGRPTTPRRPVGDVLDEPHPTPEGAHRA